MNTFITIATFGLPQEIAVLKTILEEKEIPHFFENETFIGVEPFASIALGGIKLKIKPENIAEVTEILQTLNHKIDEIR